MVKLKFVIKENVLVLRISEGPKEAAYLRAFRVDMKIKLLQPIQAQARNLKTDL